MTDETFVCLSRGWCEHLAKLSGNAVKLYNWLLIKAKFSGPDKGKITASFREIGMELRVHFQTVHKAAKELRPRYITWEAAKNQHGVTIFTVQRYKAIEDFAVSRRAKSRLTAGGQHVDSTPQNPHEQQELLVPNNGEKVGEEAVATPATFLGEEWKVLGVERPIGPPNFQRYWKSVFTHRNGQPLSELMEDCIQGWQATGSDARPQFVPRPFYAVKREVEKRERQEAERREEREMVKARIPT